MPARVIESDGWRVRLDTAAQVLAVEVPEVVYGRPRGGDLLPAIPLADGPVSAAALLLKAKRFDDGLVAAVELAAQRGCGRFPPKAGLLWSLAAALGDPPATAPVLAACRVGRLPVPTPDALEPAVRAAADRFLGDDSLSKPVGFYRWSAELADLFRQDRLLQQPLDPADADAIATALGCVPGGWASYDAVLALTSRLTNPPAGPSLRDAGQDRAVLPVSRSHEVALFERRFGDRPVPPGYDLLADLIDRVRSGGIDLTPAADAGWYDHQTWALEPLVRPGTTPEAPRLDLGPRYRRHLEDVFRGGLALARETHAKNAGGGRGGYGGPRVRPVYVGPGLTAEPVPTVYARRAAAYRFVRGVLDGAFGDGWRPLRRATADGPADPPLGDELDRVERLFDGAAAASYRELGLDLPAGAGTEAAFADWRRDLGADPDVAGDARMMVPVFYDVGRRKTKVWAFLGWRTTPADVSFAAPPVVLGVEAMRRPTSEPPPVLFVGARYEFAVPVVAEVYVTRLLDRDEFRRHCDRHRTRAAILRALA